MSVFIKKPAFLLIIALAAVGLWVCRGHIGNLHRRQSAAMLKLFGNVEIRRVNLAFRVSGRIQEICFEEGDRVSKGDVIARLDRRPYEVALASVTARHNAAQAVLRRLENGSRPQEIEEARARLDELKASLKFAEIDYDRNRELVMHSAVTQSDVDQTLAVRDMGIAKVKQAEEKLRLLEEGARQEEIEGARALCAETEANVEQAKISLADTELAAPNDGILLTRVKEDGAVVQATETIATLSLSQTVWVYVYVDEPDLGKLAPGMKVDILTDSRSVPYKGTVGYISPVAEFTPKNVETEKLRTDLVYRVRVLADTPDDGLRQGMPVTVCIPLDNAPGEAQAAPPAKAASETDSPNE